MAQNSKIEWTEKTWNPISGCSKVSQGCKNCYAEVIANRFPRTGIIPGSAMEYSTADAPKNEKFAVLLHPDRLEQPLKWRKEVPVNARYVRTEGAKGWQQVVSETGKRGKALPA